MVMLGGWIYMWFMSFKVRLLVQSIQRLSFVRSLVNQKRNGRRVRLAIAHVSVFNSDLLMQFWTTRLPGLSAVTFERVSYSTAYYYKFIILVNHQIYKLFGLYHYIFAHLSTSE